MSEIAGLHGFAEVASFVALQEKAESEKAEGRKKGDGLEVLKSL